MKCEWKDGKFEGCEDATLFLGITDENYRDTISINSGLKLKLNFCPFCGADIRKPEPKIKNKLKPFDGMYHYFSEYDEGNIIAVLKQYNGEIDEWVKV